MLGAGDVLVMDNYRCGWAVVSVCCHPSVCWVWLHRACMICIHWLMRHLHLQSGSCTSVHPDASDVLDGAGSAHLC
jgi:hypothetical protein